MKNIININKNELLYYHLFLLNIRNGNFKELKEISFFFDKKNYILQTQYSQGKLNVPVSFKEYNNEDPYMEIFTTDWDDLNKTANGLERLSGIDLMSKEVQIDGKIKGNLN